MYLVFITQSFRKRLDPYSVYSINRGSKLASGYTLDLGQLENLSNDYFENWSYPESNPAFVPSANFQLAISPVENTEFSIIYFSVSIRKNLFGLWDLNVINGLREIEDKIEKAE